MYVTQCCLEMQSQVAHVLCCNLTGVASQQAIEAQQAANDVLVLYEEGVDFSGNDIGSIRTNSAQTCAQQCQLNSQCNTFFWRKSGECFMKTARGTDVRDAEGTSGMLARSKCIFFLFAQGYDCEFSTSAHIEWMARAYAMRSDTSCQKDMMPFASLITQM